MKYMLILEELFTLGLSIFLYSKLDLAWWWYPLLFLTPDFGMLGYLINTKVGAWVYNGIHSKAVSIGLYILGAILVNPPLQLAGLILLGHSSMDRMFGFGLKYADDFKHTHLGTIN